jgi:tubulin beta
LDVVRTGDCGTLFHPNGFVFAQKGAGNNWARGYYSTTFANTVMNLTRKEMERANSLCGFQMIHSIGGGTGAGLSSKVLELMNENFGHNQYITQSCSVWPSSAVSDVVVEPYNSILAFDRLITECYQCICFDNCSLYDISTNVLKLRKPTYGDLNNLCSLVISGMTASIRFPGQLNADLRKNMANAIPFSRLHFFVSAFAPLHSVHMHDYCDTSVTSLTRESFTRKNIMCTLNPNNTFYLAVDLIYRGAHIPIKEMEKAVCQLQIEYDNSFVSWIPNNINGSIVNVAHESFHRTVTLLGNSTGITELFKRTEDKFSTMLKKKAYLYWYEKAGADEQMFSEALGNCADLRMEYDMWSQSNAQAQE